MPNEQQTTPIATSVPTPAPISAPAPFPTPTPIFTPPQPKRHLGVIVSVIVLLLILIMGGGVAYAYMAGIGPFKVTQYTESSFLTDVLAKSSQIDTASYSFSASIAVDAREQGAVAFVLPAADPSLEEKYHNDSRRASDINAISSGLLRKYGERRTYNSKTRQYDVTAGKAFPASLSATEMKDFGYGSTRSTDPVTKEQYQYTSTDGGKNFALTATFETAGAINDLKRRSWFVATTTIINGQSVTFTKDSKGIYLRSTPPEPFFVWLADSLRSLPTDISGTVAVSATTDFSAESAHNWRFGATASGDFGDLSYKVDVEALKKDKNYYVRINKMPSLPFLSFSTFKGQWIQITPEAASSSPSRGYYSRNEFSSLASGISKAEDSYKKNRAEVAEVLKSLAQLADKNKFLTFKTNPVKDTVEGRSLYRYQLDVNKDAIIPFYKEVLANPDMFKKVKLTQDQGLLDYLQGKEFEDVFAYVKGNTYLTLWTDNNGFPAVLEYRIRVVPPDTATQLNGKQIDIVFKLTLSDINKAVNIEAPKDAKPIEDVIKELDNNTDSSSSSDATVRSYLSAVRADAEIYYSSTGKNSYGTQSWFTGAAALCTGGMFKDLNVKRSLSFVDSSNGDGKNVLCYAYGTGYVAGADLPSGGWWCVDSTGASIRETGRVASTTSKGTKECP